MLYYLLFWMFMGFIIHFYIIFGTNLLTGGPAQIAIFCLFECFAEKEYQTESKRDETFGSDLFGTNANQGTWSGRHATSEAVMRVPGAPPGVGCVPRPRRPLVAPATYFLRLYILPYPQNIQEHHENLIPPPQPSVSARSLEPLPALRRRGNWPWMASTSSPRPLRWVVSSLPQSFGSIVIS